MNHWDIIIVGAGAAGCFSAAIASELNPALKIRILEKTRQPLAKVRISGGGRCNVTHHCFDPLALTQYYPRGQSFLRNAFFRFQPQDMIEWLKRHGVELKTEKDGRMFPVTDRSQTVIDCFLHLLEKQRVELSLESEVISIDRSQDQFLIGLKNGEQILSKKVLLSTGGMQKSYGLAESLGHRTVAGIPSLFTFEVEEEWIKAYSGSVAPFAIISLEGFDPTIKGPVLVTHWGLSGPATLKLSAFAARWLFDRNYQTKVVINWTGIEESQVREALFGQRKSSASKRIFATPLFSLSKNFWKALLLQVSPSFAESLWAQASKQDIQTLVELLVRTRLSMIGKSLNKEEFVTCGGIVLEEVDPKTFQSKKVAGLYFAGELLDIDGVTGGFNFQNAWSSGYLAAQSMVSKEI